MTRHLVFVFVDHFEPDWPEVMEAWLRGYPRMAERFRDSDGRPPRHTWFYDGLDGRVLDQLGALARAGLGEVEIHLHHGNDTAQTLEEKIERIKDVYAEHGALALADEPAKRVYGLAHGKWALCNSRGPEYCGVNGELAVLKRTGCYADFTFPAWGRMNPRQRNSIYYAADDPARPKAYDRGTPVAVGRAASGDLMIFEGPGDVSGLPARVARHGVLRRVLNRLWLATDITDWNPGEAGRLDRWVARGVGVEGRPEWVFVKVQTHGARDTAWSACFGPLAERFYEAMIARYNDGEAWRLHFATAREAYNMVKAAESGAAGDPGAQRDFVLGPYANTR